MVQNSVASQSSVSASEILALDNLLDELGGDDDHTYLRIHHALSYHGGHISEITAEQVEDVFAHIVTGDSFISMRSDAAYELFETY